MQAVNKDLTHQDKLFLRKHSNIDHKNLGVLIDFWYNLKKY